MHMPAGQGFAELLWIDLTHGWTGNVAFTFDFLPHIGVQGGVHYGRSDEFGYKAAMDIATIYDFHATVLHLLGLDHKRLTYYHNGTQRRLTDVHGEVLRPLLA